MSYVFVQKNGQGRSDSKSSLNDENKSSRDKKKDKGMIKELDGIHIYL